MPLKKLPGHLRAASGMEWVIFKKLPGILLGGLVLIGLITWAFHQWPPEGDSFQVTKKLLDIDIFAISLVVLLITAIGTLAFGCVIVMIMKGPAYVADGIPVVDADSPEEAEEMLRKKAERGDEGSGGSGVGGSSTGDEVAEADGDSKR